jgi:glycosyltransferase involved in cell wall biosynthesis
MPALHDWVDPCGLSVRLYGRSKSERVRGWVYAFGVAWSLFQERKNYDVAYFLMQGAHLATGLPVARLLGKPIVMKFSCSGIIVGMRDSWLGRLELRFLKRWASRILILNPGMVDEALEVGIRREQLGWMPNPVDTDHFAPCSVEERILLRQALKVGAETPVAVFVGRLDHQKKLPWMLGAFAKVVKKRPEAKLVLVGDGPLRDEIDALIGKLGLGGNVTRTGRLSSEGVLQWLQASDVFCMVSEVEGLPCSLIEAMAAGCAPVVSNIPAHSQIVEHEESGLLTDLGDEESIARGLIRALDDPGLRARLSGAARRKMVEEFSTPRVVDRYEVLFREFMA